MMLQYSKVRNVKSPIRAHDTDAGIDFFVPVLNQEFIESVCQCNDNGIYVDLESIVIAPFKRVLIPSGIHVNVPVGHALIAFNKSGVSSKHGLDVLACVVDENYQGEVHISLGNPTAEHVAISGGQKIVQFILLKINGCKPVETDLEDLYETTSERGANGFGSTN